jgi:hypothetical protein
MNTEQASLPPVLERPAPGTTVADELTRVKIFLGIQVFFLVVSVFTGSFNFKLWSMLDTALMIQSIGITALVVVLEDARHRRLAFKVAIIIYLLAVLDMGINVCVSRVVGWKTQPANASRFSSGGLSVNATGRDRRRKRPAAVLILRTFAALRITRQHLGLRPVLCRFPARPSARQPHPKPSHSPGGRSFKRAADSRDG